MEEDSMYYEINVSLNGRHFFATAERSITDKQKLKKVYKMFKEKFPEEDGYEITVTYWKHYGERINMEEA
jgi:hypothetical protein